jgi:UDP-apiose/xylose synthase
MERLIWAHGRHHGLVFTIVRPFNVIGPKMDFIPDVDGQGIPRVLACFMRALLFGESMQLVGGGRQRRSFIYVDDFVDGLLRVLLRPGTSQGQVFNLGNASNEVSMAELAALMADIYRKNHGPVADPACRSVTPDEFYGPGYDDSVFRVPELAKAEQLLDFQPRWSLAAMLEVIIDDYVRTYGRTRGP